MNWWLLFVTGFVPLITGFIWYHKSVFGNAWMKASGVTPEMSKSANMGVVFGLTYLFGLMISAAMLSIVIHQMHVGSIFADIEDKGDMLAFLEKYGTLYRTFKHGALHGFISGLFIALPIVGVIALFERKGGRYIFIHVGYWVVTMMLIGGILCQFISFK